MLRDMIGETGPAQRKVDDTYTLKQACMPDLPYHSQLDAMHALENQIRIPTCNETNYTRTDLIFWVCMALRNQLKLLR